MKKIFAFLAVLLFISTSSFLSQVPSSLTKKERRDAISLLKETKKYFLKNVKGLSDAQLDYKAAPEKWSVRQCMEHIALSESFLDKIMEATMKAPATPEKRAEIKVTDEQVVTMVEDRSKKAQAPEPIQPKGSFATSDDIINKFNEMRDKHIDFMKSTQEDLRNQCTPHPAFGMLDNYQWMLLLAAHSKRHTLQIEEVKASPGFPK